MHVFERECLNAMGEVVEQLMGFKNPVTCRLVCSSPETSIDPHVDIGLRLTVICQLVITVRANEILFRIDVSDIEPCWLRWL